MANKQKFKIDASGKADPFGHNPFGCLPVPVIATSTSDPVVGVASPSGNPEKTTHVDHILRVRREKKGRAGKTVTIVYGMDSLPSATTAEVLAKLKKTLACGGAVEDGCLILQGDQPDRVCELLNGHGFHSIRSGG